MKLLLVLFLLPLFALAQSPGRADDSLRRVSDTMHFPQPFQFNRIFTTRLKERELFHQCTQWITTLADTVQGVVVKKDVSRKKVTAGNVRATADITFSIVITVTGHTCHCSFQQYIYHTINSGRIPVEKAAMMKEYKITTNIERVIIMRKYTSIFNSLNAYIKGSG